MTISKDNVRGCFLERSDRKGDQAGEYSLKPLQASRFKLRDTGRANALLIARLASHETAREHFHDTPQMVQWAVNIEARQGSNYGEFAVGDV